MASVHLLVVIHGMWGVPQHVATIAETIRDAASSRETDGIELRVLVAETNTDVLTYDGIDNCGERVADEVYQKVKKIGEEGLEVTRLSVAGYSLGGLIGRYLVGVLLQRKFFDRVTPVNFNTFATPHIGVPRYPSFLSALACSIGPRFLSRTGEQFFVSDKWGSTGRPLLEIMADPQFIFYRALALFPNITIYANAVKDLSSPYLTSAIETEDPFLFHNSNGIEVTLDDDYPGLIKSYSFPANLAPAPPKPSFPSAEWFRNLSPISKPILPPFVRLDNPVDVMFFVSLPLLLPVWVGIVLVRFSLASRSSRKRIQSLEQDESYTKRLVHSVAEVEQQIERTLVDLSEAKDDVASSVSTTSVPGPGREPELTETQKTIVRLLNQLPNLKKERTFYPLVRNSHGTIVCRDPKRFKWHEQGREGPLKHWCDRFVF